MHRRKVTTPISIAKQRVTSEKQRTISPNFKDLGILGDWRFEAYLPSFVELA
jgi:hypothetical protein